MYCFGETGIDPAQAELSASFAKVPKQLLEFSSRLSRACLGKLIAFSYENSCVLNAVSAGLSESARHARNAYSAGLQTFFRAQRIVKPITLLSWI
eukprot:COSAG06_NODE_5551_length_3406_cov_19.727245_6_plen_95_part_00